jgi:hypothetical protein
MVFKPCEVKIQRNAWGIIGAEMLWTTILKPDYREIMRLEIEKDYEYHLEIIE